MRFIIYSTMFVAGLAMTIALAANRLTDMNEVNLLAIIQLLSVVAIGGGYCSVTFVLARRYQWQRHDYNSPAGSFARGALKGAGIGLAIGGVVVIGYAAMLVRENSAVSPGELTIRSIGLVVACTLLSSIACGIYRGIRASFREIQY